MSSGGRYATQQASSLDMSARRFAEQYRFHWLALATGPDGKSTALEGKTMSCTCISDAVKLVTDQLAEEAPGSGPFYMRAEGHNLSLNIETGNAMRRFCVEVTGHYMAPKKTGGMKRVNKTVSVVANYCPLCGKACTADDAEKTTSATSA
ncbi:hypothetical protein [Pseudomonas putida]|uniref:hypothetical protein n=1 Tax=Pseudomonas putida TaxID=303 RepID=UPI0013CF30A7|nr:hypothetical protein [Pseudomonas putida]